MHTRKLEESERSRLGASLSNQKLVCGSEHRIGGRLKAQWSVQAAENLGAGDAEHHSRLKDLWRLRSKSVYVEDTHERRISDHTDGEQEENAGEECIQGASRDAAHERRAWYEPSQWIRPCPSSTQRPLRSKSVCDTSSCT